MFKHDWVQYSLRERTASFGNHSDSSAIFIRREELTSDPDSPFTVQEFKNAVSSSSEGKESVINGKIYKFSL